MYGAPRSTGPAGKRKPFWRAVLTNVFLGDTGYHVCMHHKNGNWVIMDNATLGEAYRQWRDYRDRGYW